MIEKNYDGKRDDLEMKELLKYLKEYKKESILGPLFKLLEASFELLVPLVMAKIIDVGIKSSDSSYILKMGGFLILLGVVGLACSITAQYFAAKAAIGVGTAIRNDLFAHINKLSYGELDKIGTATLITRMTSDTNQIQSGINMFLRLFLRSPFVVFGSMVMAFTIDVKAAMIFVVTIPVLSLVVFGIMSITMPLYKNVQKKMDHVLLKVRENLLGVRVIRAFNREKDETICFEEENHLLVKLQVYVGKISSLMNPFTYIIINVSIIVLIDTGARRVEKGVLSQGEVVALVNYMSQILVELVKLASLIVTISKALACTGRVTDIFHTKPGIIEKNHEEVKESMNDPMVSFHSVSFTYEGSKIPALKNISFQAKKGETIGIIGGTGSGKTTLVNLIPRFYDVSEGSVTIGGRDVREYPVSQIRELIGIVPQKPVLFKGSLRENMKWGKKDGMDKEIFKALTISQARDFIEDKKEGLDLAIEAGGNNLSGGQKQRLTIARALIKSPKILIMDDSASALDFATDANLRKAIKEETKDMTVLIVSQRAATVKHADKIIVLDDGAMVGFGNHKELIDSCAVYREICFSQLSKKEVESYEE